MFFVLALKRNGRRGSSNDSAAATLPTRLFLDDNVAPVPGDSAGRLHSESCSFWFFDASISQVYFCFAFELLFKVFLFDGSDDFLFDIAQPLTG